METEGVPARATLECLAFKLASTSKKNETLRSVKTLLLYNIKEGDLSYLCL